MLRGLEGGVRIPVTATGYISDEGISLDVKLPRPEKDYRLDILLRASSQVQLRALLEEPAETERYSQQIR